MIKKTVFFVCVGLFLTFLFVSQIVAVWPFTIDDMFIPLRYAKHLAQGFGLLWNVNEAPVEGYSNFSFMLLGFFAIKLQLDPVACLKIAGIVGLFCSSVGLYYLSRFWFSPKWAWIPVSWLLMYPGQIIWSVSGLETTCFQTFIVFSLIFLFFGMGYRFFPEQRKQPHFISWGIAGILLALAGLTRPESPLFMLIFFGLSLVNNSRYSQQYYKGWFFGLTLLTFLYVPYFLWRWHYFGKLFPNPIYCKGLGDKPFILDFDFLIFAWPFIVGLMMAVYYKKEYRFVFLWLPLIGYLIIFSMASPLVAYGNRLFLPPFLLILPLTLIGLDAFVKWLSEKEVIDYELGLWFLVIFYAVFFIPKMNLAEYREFTTRPILGNKTRMQVSQWLIEHLKPDDSVALADAGLVPYRTNVNFIDSWCLNNACMASFNQTTMVQNMCQRILKTKPKAVILTSLNQNGILIYAPVDDCLRFESLFFNTYQLSQVFSANSPNYSYRYEIYILKN